MLALHPFFSAMSRTTLSCPALKSWPCSCGSRDSSLWPRLCLRLVSAWMVLVMRCRRLLFLVLWNGKFTCNPGCGRALKLTIYRALFCATTYVILVDLQHRRHIDKRTTQQTTERTEQQPQQQQQQQPETAEVWNCPLETLIPSSVVVMNHNV